MGKTQGTKIASEELKNRVLELNLADLNNDDIDSHKKVKLCIEEVQGRNCLTNFHGLCLTRDKLCSLIKKWQTLIEAHHDVRTTDGYLVRMFAIGFTKKRAKMVEIMNNEASKVRKIKKLTFHCLKFSFP